jgi:hypothetical protein
MECKHCGKTIYPFAKRWIKTIYVHKNEKGPDYHWCLNWFTLNNEMAEPA